MIKSGVVFFISFLVHFQLSGQAVLNVDLSKDRIVIPKRTFSIIEVEDARSQKNNFGKLKTNKNGSQVYSTFSQPLNIELEEYFEYAMPTHSILLPLKIKIKSFQLRELENIDHISFVEIDLEYYYNDILLFADKQFNELRSKRSISHRHEKNIRILLKKSIEDFNETDWTSKIQSYDPSVYVSDDYSEDVSYISLNTEKPVLINPQFNIVEVHDTRDIKSNIGYRVAAGSSIKFPFKFKNGLSDEIHNYLSNLITNSDRIIPVKVEVPFIKLLERKENNRTTRFVEIKINYLLGNQILFIDEKSMELDLDNDWLSRKENIRTLLKQSLLAFKNSGWKLKIDNIMEHLVDYEVQLLRQMPDGSAIKGRPVDVEKEFVAMDNKRFLRDIGYQLGGFTLIGMEFEKMIAPKTGFTFGGGLRGVMAGLKFHSRTEINSPFLHINFKDGGFGLIDVFAVDGGGRILFSKSNNSNLGLHFQAGFAYILNIENSLRRAVSIDSDQNFLFTIGVGLSW